MSFTPIGPVDLFNRSSRWAPYAIVSILIAIGVLTLLALPTVILLIARQGSASGMEVLAIVSLLVGVLAAFGLLIIGVILYRQIETLLEKLTAIDQQTAILAEQSMARTQAHTYAQAGTFAATLTVTGLVLPDSATANLIRFRIAETGNAAETSSNYVIPVDAAPPAAPLTVAGSPAAWTNVNSFTVTWTNPESGVGIAGAWHKVDSPPDSPSDGTFAPTQNSIVGITLPSDGAHVLYIWLQDTLGRSNPASTGTTPSRASSTSAPTAISRRTAASRWCRACGAGSPTRASCAPSPTWPTSSRCPK